MLRSVKLFCFLLVPCLFACGRLEVEPAVRQNLAIDGVYAADIKADKGLAVVSQVNGEISVFDLNTFTKLYGWRHHGDGLNLVDNVKFSTDGNYVVSSDEDTFALWSVESGEPIGFWRIDSSSIRDIALANNASAVLVGKADGTVMYFEPATSRRLEFVAHTEKINAVDIAANGRYALTAGNDYKAYLWDTKSGQIIHVFDHPHRVTKVAIDQNGKYLFTADSQNKAQIWDAQSGAKVSQLDFIERQIIFTAARFSNDSKHLLTGSPAKRLTLWDVNTGDDLMQWRVAANDGPAPQSAVVYAVDFKDDQAISIASSGNIAFWPINGGSVKQP